MRGYFELRAVQNVSSHDQHDIRPQLSGELFETEWPFESKSAFGRRLVVPESRRIEHNGIAAGNPQLLTNRYSDLIAVLGTKNLVARVSDLVDGPRVSVR